MKRRGCISVGGKVKKREVVDWGESTLSDAVTVCSYIVMLTCSGRVWVVSNWRKNMKIPDGNKVFLSEHDHVIMKKAEMIQIIS